MTTTAGSGGAGLVEDLADQVAGEGGRGAGGGQPQPGRPDLLLGLAVHLLANARSQGGEGLGSQVPEATWRSLLAEAGFSQVRRAAETPFNRVFEARP